MSETGMRADAEGGELCHRLKAACRLYEGDEHYKLDPVERI